MSQSPVSIVLRQLELSKNILVLQIKCFGLHIDLKILVVHDNKFFHYFLCYFNIGYVDKLSFKIISFFVAFYYQLISENWL